MAESERRIEQFEQSNWLKVNKLCVKSDTKLAKRMVRDIFHTFVHPVTTGPRQRALPHAIENKPTAARLLKADFRGVYIWSDTGLGTIAKLQSGG